MGFQLKEEAKLTAELLIGKLSSRRVDRSWQVLAANHIQRHHWLELYDVRAEGHVRDRSVQTDILGGERCSLRVLYARSRLLARWSQ